MSEAGVGAVVIGGDYQGLGIVRSLGRRGVPVCVVDDERSIARHSRYTTHSFRVGDLRDEARTVEALLTAGKRLGLDGWVVFPTRDETVAALAKNRETLEEQFRVPTPAWDTISWATDKRRTYELANRLGIPTPRTWIVDSVDDLAQIDGEPPYAIKPAVKSRFFYETKAKAWRADDRSELEIRFAKAHAIAPGDIVIQELIPGDGRQQFAYCALFKDGHALASMTARRLRQHPPEFGRASTYAETLDVAELEALGETVLRGVDYYGLAELEFKLDTRDGRYKLLDFNARTWGYHSLGQAAGVDFPYLLFADQLSLPVTRVRAQSGVRWVRLATDVPTAFVEIWGRRLGVRSYIESLRSADVEAVFVRDDPRPGLAELALLPYLAVRRGF